MAQKRWWLEFQWGANTPWQLNVYFIAMKKQNSKLHLFEARQLFCWVSFNCRVRSQKPAKSKMKNWIKKTKTYKHTQKPLKYNYDRFPKGVKCNLREDRTSEIYHECMINCRASFCRHRFSIQNKNLPVSIFWNRIFQLNMR